MPFLASQGCFWPLTASMTSEVKNNYAYYIPQDICNKFIELKFFVECMVGCPERGPAPGTPRQDPDVLGVGAGRR